MLSISFQIMPTVEKDVICVFNATDDKDVIVTWQKKTKNKNHIKKETILILKNDQKFIEAPHSDYHFESLSVRTNEPNGSTYACRNTSCFDKESRYFIIDSSSPGDMIHALPEGFKSLQDYNDKLEAIQSNNLAIAE